MTDSMKFGPEWLRNLSSEGTTTGAPKYQLAEHRYGREEMLALFDRNVRAPDPIVKLQGLYVEKTQTPMALLTMTEEETRQWHKGINSDAVLRLAGKSSLTGPPGGGLRGRGGSVDRGRGRARGSGGFPYTRGLSYDESDGIKETGPSERVFPRSIRSYDRSQGVERGWTERSDGDPGDWNGSTSPRKEFSTMKDFSVGGRNNTESWRRHRGTAEDEEGWRKSDKWGRSNSWRDEGNSSEGNPLSKSSSRTSSWGRGWADEGLRGRSHDEDSISNKRNNFVDEVPEWAMENPSESGGSFDASGAFHGGSYSDEEEENIGSKNARNRLSDDVELRNKSKSPPRVKKLSRNDFNNYDDECDEPNSLKDRKLTRSQTVQGNFAEPSKITSHSLGKNLRSSNPVTESPEGNSVTPKRTESLNFDRLRVQQHQEFVDKNGTNKEGSDDGEVKDKPSKMEVTEPNCVSEEVLKSETSEVTKPVVSNANEKNSVFPKDHLNILTNNTGIRLPEEETDRGAPVNRQGSEEDMERMAEVVKDTIVKLFEDEEKPPVNVDSDKWYYQDPQGVVQGPFRSSEMLEWFMNDYFPLSLLVRREQDELYVRLGYLMVLCNKIPFLPGVKLPPLKADAKLLQQLPTPTQPRPNGLYLTDFLLPDYVQSQILQKPFLISLNLAFKLSQSEMWNTLSPVQKTSLLRQTLAMAQQPPVPIEQLAQIDKNPLSQLIMQMQQQQQQNKMPMPELRDPKTLDPIRQSLQMNVMPPAQPPLVNPLNPAGVVLNHHLNPPHLNTILTNTGLNHMPALGVEEQKVEDPIQSLLRQLGNQPNMMPHPPPAPTDSLWGVPPRAPHWIPQSPPIGPAGVLPIREIKTEQQILAEQQIRLEEERRQEELRKRKEEEEEAAKRQKELEEKRKAEEEREEVKKLVMKRIEEKKQKIAQDKEKKKAEELKKKQQQEEALKKKQELAKKMQEAQKKKEEKERKKEEEREKKRLLEEEKKKLENEKKKKEKEKEEEQQRLKKKQEEEEEAAKKQEQLKRPMDALKKIQEQQQQMEPFKRPLPWSQPAVTLRGTSLSDIQKMQEKEKKQQQLREQAAQQKENQKENEVRSNGLNLKWAEQAPKTNPNVKSLVEIQAEEQLQLAKQLEKERLERAQQQREASTAANAGIWGNASQSLTWTNSTAPWGAPAVQNNPPPGFWDVVAPNTTKSKAKTPSSPVKGKSQQATTQKSGNSSGTNQKNSKPKSKKEEAAVMKLFERLGDEFTSWCSASLQSIQSDVDIPTFVSFLRDIESPYEVTDYVKCYLGDGKEAQEFAKQFLERRSRWISAQKAGSGEDDRNSSAQSLNSGSQYQANATQEFQEVKGKGKKSKKGKMLKVDNRILGFSVTAAPDRINVGDRDYVNHNL